MLHQNDFIMAAVTDDIYARWNSISDRADETLEQSVSATSQVFDCRGAARCALSTRACSVVDMPHHNRSSRPSLG
ncbi:MAG: hypothetical protein AAF125_20130 [Chloroflexota bacterium]